MFYENFNKLKKYFIFSFCALTILSFSSCKANKQISANENNDTVQNISHLESKTANESLSTENTGDVSDIAVETTDMFGNIIDIENAEILSGASMFSTDIYKINGYTYLAVCKMDVDNPDFVRTEVGTQFGDLILSEASTSYEYFPGNGVNSAYSEPSYFIQSTNASFDGSITLNGSIICLDKQEFSSEIGEIFFSADREEWENMPKIWGNSINEETHTPIFSLGLIDDYSIDTSMIPKNGTNTRVRVTLSDIVFNGTNADYPSVENTARLVEVKKCD